MYKYFPHCKVWFVFYKSLEPPNRDIKMMVKRNSKLIRCPTISVLEVGNDLWAMGTEDKELELFAEEMPHVAPSNAPGDGDSVNDKITRSILDAPLGF